MPPPLLTPPPPGPGFTWVPGERPSLQCSALAAVAGHAFTTRAWMDGPAESASLDVLWHRAAESVGLGIDHLVRVRQVHGAAVVVETEAARTPCEADALIGNDSARALAVQTADCVPVLMADVRGGWVAAVHAGWRGLAAGVLAAAVEGLTHHGVRPADIVAAVGPAIGPCCYEVGADVRDAVRESARTIVRPTSGGSAEEADAWFLEQPAVLAHNPSALAPPRPGHWCFDTWSAARWQLVQAGLRADRIFVAALCTASHPEWFCSYRREGRRAGRMAAVIRSGASRSA